MTEYHSFEGKVYLAKVYEPEVVFHKLQWTLMFEPKDDVELGKVLATGLKIKPVKDKYTDKMRVSFRRPTEREFSDETVQFNPPAIYGAVTSKFIDRETNKGIYSYTKGKAPKTMAYVGDAVPITNGTTAKVNISVYETGQGKGHRLESLYIMELAPAWSPEKNEAEIHDELPDFVSPTNSVTEVEETITLKDKAPW